MNEVSSRHTAEEPQQIDWPMIMEAFSKVSGIPSPLERGSDLEAHYIHYGDPFRVYKEAGKCGELLGFAEAFNGNELPLEPINSKYSAILRMIVPLSQWARDKINQTLRFAELKKGFDSFQQTQ